MREHFRPVKDPCGKTTFGIYGDENFEFRGERGGKQAADGAFYYEVCPCLYAGSDCFGFGHGSSAVVGNRELELLDLYGAVIFGNELSVRAGS